jgi:hypothetical protein
LEKTINTWEQKDTLNKEIISNVEQKFKIVNDQNDELRKEVKKLKAKNTITQIVSGALITTLTVFSIMK